MSRLGFITVCVFGLLFLAACSDPAADKSKAVTGEAASVSPAVVKGEKYAITPENSKIEFTGSNVTGSHNGAFKKFSGDIDFNGTPEKSRVNLTIETDSLAADDDGLTKHLKTADFFDVAKFPQATFVSTEIKPGGEQGASHTVTGNLTLHGVTKSVTFPATIAVAPTGVTVDSTFSINRKDFGINFSGQTDNLIRDAVVLKLNVRATK